MSFKSLLIMSFYSFPGSSWFPVHAVKVPSLQCFDAVGWAAGRASGL